MALWNQQDAEHSLVQFRKAAQIDDQDPELWVMIGRCEVVSGRGDSALRSWEEALRRSPRYKAALFERAKEALGRHVARRISPPVDGASGWLPLQLGLAGQLEGGAEEERQILSDLREAASHTPAFSNLARGAIFLLDGLYADALKSMQHYADLNEWDATALGLLGIAAQYAALPARAERALSSAFERRSDKVWLRVRADARYLLGNLKGARQDYRDSGLEKESEPLFVRLIPARGLILWLRADSGVDAIGATVTRWKDQSNGKHDAVPEKPSTGPQLSTAALGGHPTIVFSGKGDELFLPDGFEDFSAGLSAFVVGEPMVDPEDEWSFLLLATPGRVEVQLGRRRGSDEVVYTAEDIQIQTKPFIGGIPPRKGFEEIGAIHEPSGTARLYKRGTRVGEGMLLFPRKIFRTRNRVGPGLKGQIAEILLYNRSLLEMERLGVDAHLRSQYFPDTTSDEKR